MVLGEPIQHMLGALKYPKENKKFRKTFNLPETEAIVACKYYQVSENTEKYLTARSNEIELHFDASDRSRFL